MKDLQSPKRLKTPRPEGKHLPGARGGVTMRLLEGSEQEPTIAQSMRRLLVAKTFGSSCTAAQNIGAGRMNVRVLVGSGDRIGSLVLPFLMIGLLLNVLGPSLFSVGGPPAALTVLSILILIPGITVWIWSVLLILTKVPRQELMTSGPYSIVRHPLYTGVAFLVLPWVGFLLDTWLGVLVGIVLYVASRIFSPEEERALAGTFGAAWDEYCKRVKIPWL